MVKPREFLLMHQGLSAARRSERRQMLSVLDRIRQSLPFFFRPRADLLIAK